MLHRWWYDEVGGSRGIVPRERRLGVEERGTGPARTGLCTARCLRWEGGRAGQFAVRSAADVLRPVCTISLPKRIKDVPETFAYTLEPRKSVSLGRPSRAAGLQEPRGAGDRRAAPV